MAGEPFVHQRRIYPPLMPLADETAESLAFRCANRQHLTLHEYCRFVLQMNHDRLFADLENVLCGDAANVLGNCCGVAIEEIWRLRVPKGWKRTTRQRGSRRQSARVLVCPQCLKDRGTHGQRAWQSRFALTCLVHQVFLIDNCPRCHVPICYRDPEYHVHWLDRANRCANCRYPFPDAVPAPAPFARAGERWRLAMAGCESDGWEPPDLLILSDRLAKIRWDEKTIRRYWPPGMLGHSDSVGLTALILNAATDMRFQEEGRLAHALFYALCGGLFDADDLLQGLQDEILPLGQLCLRLR